MTPEAQRIAIAEACGWKDCAVDTLQVYCDDATEPGFVEQKPLRGTKDGQKDRQRFKLPDYLNDLNAMHEAEKVLSHEQLLGFDRHLSELFLSAQHQHCIHATAAQRAEPFLKAIGKWVEE